MSSRIVTASLLVVLTMVPTLYGQQEHHCSLHAGVPIEHQCNGSNIKDDPNGDDRCYSYSALESWFGPPFQCAWPYSNWSKCVEAHQVRELSGSCLLPNGDRIPAGKCLLSQQTCGDGRTVSCYGQREHDQFSALTLSSFRQIECTRILFGGYLERVSFSCRDGDQGE